jgi:hypothetical protein
MPNVFYRFVRDFKELTEHLFCPSSSAALSAALPKP